MMRPDLIVYTEARAVAQLGCDTCPSKKMVVAGGLAGMACMRSLDSAAVPYRITETVEAFVSGVKGVNNLSTNAYQGVGGSVEACSSVCVGEGKLDRAKEGLVGSLKSAGFPQVQQYF